MRPTDIGHGRGWLDAPAAASVRRIDRQLGRPADVNDAGRSAVQADANYARWVAYQNGGPWAPYAFPASKSVHVKGGAVDSDDWYNAHAAAVWRDNGWRQTARYNDDRDEPWHGEYFAHLDNHRNDPIPAGAADDKNEQENDVNVKVYVHKETNKLLLVDHLNMRVRDLGSDNNLERQKFDRGALQTIPDKDWTAMFTGWPYVERENALAMVKVQTE